MSRASTSSTSQQGSQTYQGGGPAYQGGGQAQQIPHEKIAMRAYEKWCRRGRPHGTDKQDWLEAEQELRGEATRGGSGTPGRR
jgi:hypothetical protein